MANPSVTYTFVNSTTADATQVNQNFTDLINSLTDGTKSLTVDAITAGGTVTLNGDVNLGNASGDTITATGTFDSALIPNASETYALGSATVGWSGIYLADNSQRVGILPSASMSATWNLTLPTTAGSTSQLLRNSGSGALAWTGVTIDASDNVNFQSGNLTTGGTITADDCIVLNGDYITFGANANTKGTLTNSAIKLLRFGSPHYTSDTYNGVCAFFANNQAAANDLYIGGGTSSFTAATSIYFNTAANNTTTAGTTRMTINSSGKVGIGTTSPGAVLEVKPAADATNQELFNITDAGAGNGFLVRQDASNNIYVDIYDGSHTNDIRFNTAGDSWFNGGNVGIGTTSPDDELHIEKTTANTDCIVKCEAASKTTVGVASAFRAFIGATGYADFGSYNNGTNNAGYYLLRNAGGGTFGYFYMDSNRYLLVSNNSANIGTTTGTTIDGQTSDERSKINIVDLDQGLDQIKQLRPIRYDLLDYNGEFYKHEVGFGAQSTLPIIPEAVRFTGEKFEGREDEPDRMQMEYVRLMPAMVKAIQELSSNQDSQTELIQALLARVEALEAR